MSKMELYTNKESSMEMNEAPVKMSTFWTSSRVEMLPQKPDCLGVPSRISNEAMMSEAPANAKGVRTIPAMET